MVYPLSCALCLENSKNNDELKEVFRSKDWNEIYIAYDSIAASQFERIVGQYKTAAQQL